jgi:hypothetical protein
MTENYDYLTTKNLSDLIEIITSIISKRVAHKVNKFNNFQCFYDSSITSLKIIFYDKSLHQKLRYGECRIRSDGD